MRNKRLLMALTVLALVGLMGGSAAFAAASAAQPAQQTATDEVGLVIVSVDPDGPAAAAGVARGDILLAIGAQETNNAQDVSAAMADLKAGDEVDLALTHGDDERTLTVTVGDRNGRAYLGIQPYYGLERQVTARVDRLMPVASGATVLEVVADSPAEQAGLAVGDVIVSVDGETLAGGASLADVIGALQPGDTATLEVQRAGEDANLTLDVTLAENPDKAGVAYLGVRYAPAQSAALETMPFDDNGMPFFHRRGMPTPDNMPSMPGMPDFNLDELPFGQAESGVIVASVAADSPAAAAGLVEGDVIAAVDGQEVQTPEEVVAIVGDKKPGDAITLSVRSEGADEAADVVVTLGARPDDEARAFLGVSLGVFQSMRSERIVPGQGQFEFQLPFGQDDSQSDDGSQPSDQQPQSPLDLLQQLFPGLSSQQQS